MRKLLVLAASSIAFGSAVLAAAAAIKVPPAPKLPAGWSRAQINVVIKRVPHTITYDHGRITTVSPTSLTLKEPDGSVVTIVVNTSTKVTIDGRPASIAQVKRSETATVASVDGGPAAQATVRTRAPLARSIGG
jgi:hypothetical protein